MKTETNYNRFDLKGGTCTSCGEVTDEILIGDGRCIDCVEEEKFFDETMKSEPPDPL